MELGTNGYVELGGGVGRVGGDQSGGVENTVDNIPRVCLICDPVHHTNLKCSGTKTHN
jgi:hypothetical protein